MKRLLIISEHDAVEKKLNQFTDNLFAHEKKEIFVCNINLIDCKLIEYQYPTIFARKQAAKLPSVVSALDVINYSYTFKERFNARNCKEIMDIVKEKEINCVLLPVFINDEPHWQYYRAISIELKKRGGLEVIGLMI